MVGSVVECCVGEFVHGIDGSLVQKKIRSKVRFTFLEIFSQTLAISEYPLTCSDRGGHQRMRPTQPPPTAGPISSWDDETLTWLCFLSFCLFFIS